MTAMRIGMVTVPPVLPGPGTTRPATPMFMVSMPPARVQLRVTSVIEAW